MQHYSYAFLLVSRPDSAVFSLASSLIIDCLKLLKEVFSWLKQAETSSKFMKKAPFGLSNGKQESVYHFLFFLIQ